MKTPTDYGPNISYGIRYWNGYKWLYLHQTFTESRGWVDEWLNTDSHCWTTSSILSAMFTAQKLAVAMPKKSAVCLYVIQFTSVTTVWSTHADNRCLELECLAENLRRRDKIKPTEDERR